MQGKGHGASFTGEAPQDFGTGFVGNDDAVSIGECTTAPLPGTTDIPCQRCGSLGPHAEQPGVEPHRAKLVCIDCGTFMRWLPTHLPAARAARAAFYRQAYRAQLPPTEKQLAYLQHLGHTGPQPVNRLIASEAIDALVARRSRL